MIIVSNLLWFLPTIFSLRSSVSSVEEATLDAMVEKINSFLNEKEFEVKVAARFVLENLNDRGNDLLVQQILKEDHFSSVALSDKNGNEIIKYNKFKTVPFEDLTNILDRSDFKDVVRTEKTSWSDVDVSERLEPFITLNIPVFSKSREFIGVISATISVSPIFRVLANININNWKAYVTDSNGMLISDPDLSLVLRGNDYSNRKIVQDALRSQHTIISAVDNTYVYEDNYGIEMFAVAKKIQKTNWVVVFEEPRTSALKNIIKLIVFAIGSFILMSFFIFLMYRVNLKVIAGRTELEKNFSVQVELSHNLEESKKDIEAVNSHLKEKDLKLVEKVAELEYFQKFLVDREIRMAELKKEIAELKLKK
ncbi:MAG: cache domain-containing protein [Patescibacteria group bacterium]